MTPSNVIQRPNTHSTGVLSLAMGTKSLCRYCDDYPRSLLSVVLFVGGWSEVGGTRIDGAGYGVEAVIGSGSFGVGWCRCLSGPAY